MKLFVLILFLSLNVFAQKHSFYDAISSDELLEIQFKKEILLKSKSQKSFPINVDEGTKCSLTAESKKEEIYVSAGSKWKAEKAYITSPTLSNLVDISYRLTNKTDKSITMECNLNRLGKLYTTVEAFTKAFKSQGIDLVFFETNKKEVWGNDPIKKSLPAKSKSSN